MLVINYTDRKIRGTQNQQKPEMEKGKKKKTKNEIAWRERKIRETESVR